MVERQPKPRSCAAWCQKCTMMIPVIFVLAMVGWSYFAFIVAFGSRIPDLAARVIIAIVYHVLLIMFLWSYLMAIFSNPGRPPESFYLTEEEHTAMRASDRGRSVLDSISARVTVHERTAAGNMRYCDQCKCIKPDRGHHCSMCMQCVLKMDHHCPWVGNCVGFRNYKFFVLFLTYTCFYTLFIVACCAPFIAEFWNDKTNSSAKFHVLIMFLVALVFFFTVFGLFSFHAYLLLNNKTTLESSRAPCFRGGFADSKHYDLGYSGNFQQVFGKNPLYWPLPIHSSLGNGIEFETRAYTNTATDVPIVSTTNVNNDSVP